MVLPLAALPDDLFTITGKSTISTVSIAPDGKLIAVGAADGSITLCAAETGQAIASFGQHPAGIRRMEFSRDGKRLVTGNNGGLVKVWDVAERKEILTIQAHENKAVFAVTFSPDGQMVASASDDNTAKLWSATTGARIQTLKGHTEWVRSVQTILTSSNDQTVRLWNVATGKQ